MKQSAKRLVSMVVALAMTVAAFIIFFKLTQPVYQNVQAIKGEQVSRQAFIDGKKAAIREVQRLIKNYRDDAELQDAQTAVQISFPIDAEIASALVQLNGLAVLNNLTVQSIGISDSPAKAERLSSSNSSKSRASFAKPFNKISFAVSASGNYEDMKRFLENLETNLRLFDIESMNVNPQSRPGQSQYQYSIRVMAYYQGR